MLLLFAHKSFAIELVCQSDRRDWMPSSKCSSNNPCPIGHRWEKDANSCRDFCSQTLVVVVRVSSISIGQSSFANNNKRRLRTKLRMKDLVANRLLTNSDLRFSFDLNFLLFSKLLLLPLLDKVVDDFWMLRSDPVKPFNSDRSVFIE